MPEIIPIVENLSSYLWDTILATGEILPSIDYYDQRGNNTVFYFAGYDPESVKAAHSNVKGPGNETWYFEARAFNNFREEVERRTTWRYSGGTDMILTNARFEQIEATYKAGLISIPRVPSGWTS